MVSLSAEFRGVSYGDSAMSGVALGHNSQMVLDQTQAQFQMAQPQPDFEYVEPEVQAQIDVNPELISRVENCTMLPDMAFKAGESTLGGLFNAGCDLAEQSMLVQAEMMPEPDLAPIAVAPDPVPEYQNTYTHTPPMGM